MNRSFKIYLITLPAILLLGACQQPGQLSGGDAPGRTLDAARFTEDDRLLKPDVEQWVFLGTNIGLGYATGEFNSDKPGTIQVVHMEPEAFRHYRENGDFADGTLFSLSFYETQEKSDPQLNGFSQGDLISSEIHLIDSRRFAGRRAFYLFSDNAASAARIPPDNECESCHNEHGANDGVFTQFYPPLRGLQDD